MQYDIRAYHSSNPMNASREIAHLDFAFMPTIENAETLTAENTRLPLLPDNYDLARKSNQHLEPVESVIRPEISTVSANGTHIDSPSAMSEVTDNHAVDMDVYDLTKKVTNAAALQVTGISAAKLQESGVVKELWTGVIDDIFGEKTAKG